MINKKDILPHLSRILVGTLFIISGLVKANDALGFSYKLEEYFSAAVLDLVFLEPYALAMAIVICVLEIVLGVAVIIGYKPKLTSWLLLILILGFTYLTFYSAYFDKVTDCGCFGDAVKLTPWQSFTKDIVLLVLIAIIFINQKTIKPFKSAAIDFGFAAISIGLLSWFSIKQLGWIFPIIFTGLLLGTHFILKLINNSKTQGFTIIFTLALATFFSFYTYYALPIKDFRPYAIGKNITEQMTLPADAQKEVSEMTFTYQNKKTGENQEFTMENYPWKDTLNWKFVSRDTKILIPGDEPKIHDFNLTATDGNDYTEDILGEEFMLLAVMYDVDKASTRTIEKLGNLAKDAYENEIYIYGVSASPTEKVEKFRHDNQLAFDFLAADAIVLKTMIRSNPGIILLHKGTVIGKWPSTAIPQISEIKTLKSLQ